MQAPVIEGFAKRVHARGRYGFDWSIIIGIALQFLEGCMNDRDTLQATAQSGLNRSQKSALIHDCQQRMRGRVVLWRRVGERLADHVEEELKATAGGERMGSDGIDVFQEALNEARSLLG